MHIGEKLIQKVDSKSIENKSAYTPTNPTLLQNQALPNYEYNKCFIKNIKHISFTAKRTQFTESLLREFWNTITHLKSSEWNGETWIKNSALAQKLKFIEFLSPEEQKTFIELFKRETGFPHLDNVSKRMEQEVVTGINKLAAEHDFKVLYGTYDKNCSVSKQVAFPGSDMDALFFVIDGPKSSSYRGLLPNKINQRLVSTSGNHLPEVIPLQLLKESVELAENAFGRLCQDLKKQNKLQDLEKYESSLNRANKDYSEAADFNIQISKYIPKELKWDVIKAGMLMEMIREGHPIINTLDEETIKFFKNSTLYKYSNMMQQRALNDIPKEKWQARKSFLKDFDNLSIQEQFDLIKTIIHSSAENQPPKNASYSNCFYNQGQGTYCASDSMGKMYQALTN